MAGTKAQTRRRSKRRTKMTAPKRPSSTTRRPWTKLGEGCLAFTWTLRMEVEHPRPARMTLIEDRPGEFCTHLAPRQSRMNLIPRINRHLHDIDPPRGAQFVSDLLLPRRPARAGAAYP